jgi:hypothetical protein
MGLLTTATWHKEPYLARVREAATAEAAPQLNQQTTRSPGEGVRSAIALNGVLAAEVVDGAEGVGERAAGAVPQLAQLVIGWDRPYRAFPQLCEPGPKRLRGVLNAVQLLDDVIEAGIHL